VKRTRAAAQDVQRTRAAAQDVQRTRAAAHVHSDWSYDGSWSLAEIAAAFGRRGYDAVLLAEHDRGFDPARWSAYRAACAEASTPTSLLVPGIEYSDPSNTVHVPVWGDIPFLGEGLQTGELLERAASAGGLAVLAHPGRRDVWMRFDPAWMRHLVGVELWNRKYDGYAPNRAAASLLRERPELLPVVSLDFHTARQFHPLAMLFELDGDATEARICAALRERRSRPTAFRIPALHLARSPAWPALRGLERARKSAAVRVRSARGLAGRLRPRG
jgi:hypothetical protein